MYTLSLDIPSVQRRVEREDDTINDPLAILIAAEEELEFEFDTTCTKCNRRLTSQNNDMVWDGRCSDCM